MPEKVLIYSRFPKAMMARIGQRFDLMDAAGKPPAEVFTAEQLSGVRALITAGGTPLGAAVPGHAAVVARRSSATAPVMTASILRPRPNATSRSATARLRMPPPSPTSPSRLMLAVTRRLLPADEFVRNGSWSAAKPSPLLRPQPGNPGRRVGVYGMGEIGRKIAARVAAFETEVGYFSRSRHDVPYQYLPSLEALAEWCSVLMIAVRAGADTHHAVNAAILQKLGKDGYVVNISRGSVIDEPALVAALADNTIAGAGLDVFEKEPHAPDALTGVSERRADPACRRPHHRVAHRDAGLRDRQSRGVFCRQAAGLSREVTDRAA